MDMSDQESDLRNAGTIVGAGGISIPRVQVNQYSSHGSRDAAMGSIFRAVALLLLIRDRKNESGEPVDADSLLGRLTVILQRLITIHQSVRVIDLRDPSISGGEPGDSELPDIELAPLDPSDGSLSGIELGQVIAFLYEAWSNVEDSLNTGLALRNLISWLAGDTLTAFDAQVLQGRDRSMPVDLLHSRVGDLPQATSSIWTDSSDFRRLRDLELSVRGLIDVIGLTANEPATRQRGSWWVRMRTRVQRGVSSQEVQIRLKNVERALQLAQVDSRQAEVDSRESEAVARVLDSMRDLENVCIRIGSLLFVKTGGSVLVRQLSQIEMHALATYPELQSQPGKILDALSLAVGRVEVEVASGD